MKRIHALAARWRRRKCRRINRYCVVHDVSIGDHPEVRRRCPTFAREE